MQILIVKTSSLGDIVHSFPVLNYLKAKFPDASIDWVVEKPYAEILMNHPHIRDVLLIDTKKWRTNYLKHLSEIRTFDKQLRQRQYDCVFDLQGNTKSAAVTLRARAPVKVGFDKTSVTEWTNVWATTHRYQPPRGKTIYDDYLFLAQRHFNDFTVPISFRVDLKGTAPSFSLPRPHILVSPNSAWPNKQLDPVALQRLLRNIQQESPCSYIFVWGNEQEKQHVLALQAAVGGVVAPCMSIPDLQALMQQVDRVIAMDSMALHLAGTTGTPTFSVFGPSLANRYHPVGPQHTAVQGACPYNQSFEKRCPLLRKCPTGACMKQFDGDTLFQHWKEQSNE